VTPSHIPSPLLIVNGAEERLQLVIADQGKLLASRELVAPGRSMQVLVPEIMSMLSILVQNNPPLGGIACVQGPGSFTSIRLILATTFGLARGWAIPMAGIPYLPLLASGPAPLLSGELWVATHARQRQIYLQSFAVPSCAPLFPAFSPTLEQVERLIEKIAHPPFVLGSSLSRNEDFWESLSDKVTLLDPGWNTPRAVDLVRAACGSVFTHAPPQPIYLRPTDAEENLETFCSRRGITIDDARCRIPSFGMEN
jgi:tRNA threonylcarbamoyladenosine biosynthesis protein TsaB